MYSHEQLFCFPITLNYHQKLKYFFKKSKLEQLSCNYFYYNILIVFSKLNSIFLNCFCWVDKKLELNFPTFNFSYLVV